MARARRRAFLNPTSKFCKSYFGGKQLRGKKKKARRVRIPKQHRPRFIDLLYELGFTSYESYLKSDLWRDIRSRAFDHWGHRCRPCGMPAREIHHSNYDIETLRGDSLHGLWPLCGNCHRRIHEGGASLKEANARLLRLSKSRT